MKRLEGVEDPIDFLLVHGWVLRLLDEGAGRRSVEYWIHPNELSSEHPGMWFPREAVRIALSNEQFALVEREANWMRGNSMGVFDGYYNFISEVVARDPVNGRRPRLKLKNAFARCVEAGWPNTPRLKKPPTLKAILDGNDLKIWCMYCGLWHHHGVGGVKQRIGFKTHRMSHCSGALRMGGGLGITPYDAAGYYLKVVERR